MDVEFSSWNARPDSKTVCAGNRCTRGAFPPRDSLVSTIVCWPVAAIRPGGGPHGSLGALPSIGISRPQIRTAWGLSTFTIPQCRSASWDWPRAQAARFGAMQRLTPSYPVVRLRSACDITEALILSRGALLLGPTE